MKSRVVIFTGKEHKTLDDRIAGQVANACGVEHHLLRMDDNFFSDLASHADRTVYVTDGSFGVTGAMKFILTAGPAVGPGASDGVFGSEISETRHL